jgi:cob(I)alamin adenosyltransferase
MKIYTGSGDRGKTSLFSGERLSKNDARIEAYGYVDELNSCLGVLAAALDPDSESRKEIRAIQSILLQTGAWLATMPLSSTTAELEVFSEKSIHDMEAAIDRMEQALRPLNDFILPGGQMTAALAHVARTVCRRAERHVVAISDAHEGDQLPESYRLLLVYLNRLSDYLFVLARYCNHLAGEEDLIWKG